MAATRPVKTATVVKSAKSKLDEYMAQTMAIGISREQERLRLQKGLIPLSCYILKDGTWDHMEFPRDKRLIDLTFGDHDSEDQTKYKVNIKLLHGFWFASNLSKNENVYFNGFHKPNDLLIASSTSLIEAGDTSIIITNRPPSSLDQDNNDDIKKGPPQKGEYSIKTAKGEYRYSEFKAVFIGQHPICDLHIEGQEEQFTAVIAMHLGKPYIVNFGTTNIIINEQAMTEPMVPLKKGCMIQIDDNTFTINASSCLQSFDESSEANERLSFIEINNEGITHNKLLLPSQDIISVGRSNDTDFPIINNSISTLHAEVIVFLDHILVIDNESTNGTFINNEKISKERAYPGDIVSFGNKNYLLTSFD